MEERKRKKVDDLLIISKKWSTNRGQYTSVERFCSLLKADFAEDHGRLLKMNRRIALMLKNLSSSRCAGNLPLPYNSYSAGIEFFGLKKAWKLRPSYVFFPYGDYDYNYFGFFKRFIACKIIIWTFFSEWELEHRFRNLNHFRRADLILAAGRDQTSYLMKKLPGKKTVYFPMGVDTAFFRESESYEPLRIVQAGHNRRDFETAIKALDLLYQDFPSLRVDFIGVGRVKDTIPPRPYIVIHPFLTDEEMLKVYQAASFQILPVLDGGSSNSLNEGMACGLPLVATRINNMKDYLHPDYSLTFDKGDYTCMYENCRSLLLDPDLRTSMSKAARKAALKYDWKELIHTFYRILEELAD
jgi:glycosyltransferase involved in cell wall biosynthesis